HLGVSAQTPLSPHSLCKREIRTNLQQILKNFTCSNNRYYLNFHQREYISLFFAGEPVPVGCMVINSVAKLRLLTESNIYSLPSAPTLADLDFEDAFEEGHEEPHFDSRSRIFELDPCGGNGRACLVYKDCSPGDQLKHKPYYHLLVSTLIIYFFSITDTHIGRFEV
uniref:Tubulin polyglutamylase complex subunit 2 n=1 Tax=Astyanax mexicanus TaxID=7994 RepID=A0A8B9KAX4_ASTMX